MLYIQKKIFKEIIIENDDLEINLFYVGDYEVSISIQII